MQATRSRLLIAILSVLSVAACGGGGGGGSSDSGGSANPAGGGSGDTTAPTVVSVVATGPSGAGTVLGTTPATGIPGTSTIDATFSEAVSGIGVSSMTVSALGAQVSGSVSANVNKLAGRFAPTSPFACNVLHTVNLTAGIIDLASNPLVPVARQFSTRQIDTWSFVDGGNIPGINRDTNRAATAPRTVSHNGKLYATWAETPTGGGAGVIRVAVLQGTDAAPAWQPVDGDVTFGLNFANGFDGRAPMLAVNAGRLYAIWVEVPTAGSTVYQVRVASYNGNDALPDWTFVDINSSGNGLNVQKTRTASSPSLVSVAGRLYAIWTESKALTPSGTANQVRAYRYNGDGTTSSWAPIDGGNLTDGINFSNTRDGANPAGIAFNDKLYITWDEAGAVAANRQIRVKAYTPGAGNTLGTWAWWEDTAATPAATGLNRNTAQPARDASFAILGNRLFLIWGETAAGVRQIRVRAHDGASATPAWAFVDGGGTTGINRNVTLPATDPTTPDASSPPRLALANGQLYATWIEATATTAGATTQVRVKAYDGSGSASTNWKSVDGDAVTGLNRNAGTQRSATGPGVVGVGSRLYALWSEDNGTGAAQIRAKLAGCP